jgi:SAM-dependent methyltransferase
MTPITPLFLPLLIHLLLSFNARVTSTTSPPGTSTVTYFNGLPDQTRYDPPPTFPHWHWAMIHDHSRNQAYDRALHWTLQEEFNNSNVTVFDIGAGAGLLSLLAAQHGAAHVYAIEHSPELAAMARTVVADNAFEHIVKVHDGDVLDLPEVPLSIRPDEPRIIVHELFAQHMLCEMVHQIIPTVHRLVHPVRVIPRTATTFAVLVDSKYLSQDTNAVLGFNFQSAGQHFEQSDLLGTSALPLDDLIQLSHPMPLFSTDFNTSIKNVVRQESLRQGETFDTIRNGTVRGVLLYWTAEMVPGVNLSTSPFIEVPSRARLEGWPTVIFDVLTKNAPRGGADDEKEKRSATEPEIDWSGWVDKGDRVGFRWGHYWPKSYAWVESLRQMNATRTNDGCAARIVLDSYNGKRISRRNRRSSGEKLYSTRVDYDAGL